MLTFSQPGSRIQESKGHPIPDPGSGSATLIVIIINIQVRTPIHFIGELLFLHIWRQTFDLNIIENVKNK
jgi:hypothetical protein